MVNYVFVSFAPLLPSDKCNNPTSNSIFSIAY